MRYFALSETRSDSDCAHRLLSAVHPPKDDQRLPREIASFFNMPCKVVRATPRRSAVTLMTPPASRSGAGCFWEGQEQPKGRGSDLATTRSGLVYTCGQPKRRMLLERVRHYGHFT